MIYAIIRYHWNWKKFYSTCNRGKNYTFRGRNIRIGEVGKFREGIDDDYSILFLMILESVFGYISK